MGRPQGYRESFVLRVWWETEEGERCWRGWIQHAASGNNRYFLRIDDLLTFVQRYTGRLVEPQTRKE